MKLTKEDYMRLPKERLAELLVEADNRPEIEYIQMPMPATPYVPQEPYGPFPITCLGRSGDATSSEKAK